MPVANRAPIMLLIKTQYMLDNVMPKRQARRTAVSYQIDSALSYRKHRTSLFSIHHHLQLIPTLPLNSLYFLRRDVPFAVCLILIIGNFER